MGQLFGNSVASTIFSRREKAEEFKSKIEKVPTDFCSPIILTGSPGYSLYVRLFPFGCEVAAGNHVSVFVALIPGMYDAILEWPCFKRPSSCKGNLSVGILHFLPHR